MCVLHAVGLSQAELTGCLELGSLKAPESMSHSLPHIYNCFTAECRNTFYINSSAAAQLLRTTTLYVQWKRAGGRTLQIQRDEPLDRRKLHGDDNLLWKYRDENRFFGAIWLVSGECFPWGHGDVPCGEISIDTGALHRHPCFPSVSYGEFCLVLFLLTPAQPISMQVCLIRV